MKAPDGGPFDVALIGTAPLTLIEGARLAKMGRRVIFIDKAGAIGGAWRSRDVLGFDNVEVGVHLIENRHRVRDWLAGLPIELAPQHGFGLFGPVRIPLPLTRLVFHTMVAAKAAARRDWDSWARIALSARRALLNLPTPLLYPASGFSSLIACLQDDLIRRSAQFAFGTAVTDLRDTGKAVEVATDRFSLTVSKVVMSSRAHADIAGVSPAQAARRARTCSYVLHLAQAEPAFSGYVEVIGNRSIRRLRDIGPFARPRPEPGQALICVQSRDEMAGQDSEIGAVLIARLTALGLLRPGARLAGLHRELVPLTTLGQADLRRVNGTYGDRISVLPSTDFADCLESRLIETP